MEKNAQNQPAKEREVNADADPALDDDFDISDDEDGN